MMLAIVLLTTLTVLAVMAPIKGRYDKCCGKNIVSQRWLFCPFCGGDLDAGTPVRVPKMKSQKATKKATKITTASPSKAKRTSPLKPASDSGLLCLKVGGAKKLACSLIRDHTHRHRYTLPATVLDF